MQIIRKSMLGAVVLLFTSTLFLFGLSFGLLHVFGSSDSIKRALARSGIYQSVIGDALKQAQEDQKTAETESIPLDRPEVQDLIKTAASPELLQTKTENALDSVYAWLHGETPNLTFNLEIGDIKTNLANGVEQYVAQRVASLPVCAPEAADNVSEDPLSAACRPEGIDAKTVAAKAKNELLNNEALKDTTISANTLKMDNGETVAQRVEKLPNAYKAVAWSVYGSGLFALLLAAGVILLSSTWRSGVKKVSIIIIVLGALSAGLSLLAGAGMSRAAGVVKEPLQQSFVKVAEALVGDLRSWWLWYGVALVVAGIAALIALRFLKSKEVAPAVVPRTDQSPEPTGEQLPPPSRTAPAPASTEIHDRQRPVKKLIQ